MKIAGIVLMLVACASLAAPKKGEREREMEHAERERRREREREREKERERERETQKMNEKYDTKKKMVENVKF